MDSESRICVSENRISVGEDKTGTHGIYLEKVAAEQPGIVRVMYEQEWLKESNNRINLLLFFTENEIMLVVIKVLETSK